MLKMVVMLLGSTVPCDVPIAICRFQIVSLVPRDAEGCDQRPVTPSVCLS